MKNFSDKKYIIISAIPLLNFIFLIYLLFTLCKTDNLFKKLFSAVIGMLIVFIFIYMIPQKLFSLIEFSQQVRSIIDFIHLHIVMLLCLNVNFIKVLNKCAE